MFGPILVHKYDTMVELTYSNKPTNLLKAIYKFKLQAPGNNKLVYSKWYAKFSLG